MNLVIEPYTALCELREFKINGIAADYHDFGDKWDRSPAPAEAYCCGNMQFSESRPTHEVLEKYKITYDEWYEVADKLADVLSFGACCWCS